MTIIAPAAFTTWADMRSRVLRKAPECPGFRIDDALKEAANEFFSTSCVWRMLRATLLTTVADTTDYAYTPPTNGEVNRVHSAWDGTDELDVMLPGEEDDSEPDDETDQFKVGCRPTNTLYLSHVPVTAGNVVAGTLSFKPSVAAVGIPTEAWTLWAEEIACGAAAMLVTEPLKPWSQPSTHAFLRGKFDEGIRDASISAGPTRRRPLRVTPL
jgi:hypothetical protein